MPWLEQVAAQVLRSTATQMRMILGGEVDCITEPKDSTQPLSPSQFVELKTNMTIESSKDEFRFEKFKLLKFYMVRN